MPTSKREDMGTSWSATTLAKAKGTAFAEANISVQLLRKEDLNNDDSTLNPRTFLTANALNILASFNPDRMTKCHIAVEARGAAKAYVADPVVKENLHYILEVLADRDGILKPDISNSSPAYTRVQLLCGLPATQALTRDAMARVGLLLPDGTLPEDLLIHPITGNHSS